MGSHAGATAVQWVMGTVVGMLIPTTLPHPRVVAFRRPDPAPVIVALAPRDRAPLARATQLAATAGSPLHLVVGVSLPPSPLSLLRRVRRSGMPHHALQVVEGLRTSGLHVEVHTTTGRPGHLATEIAKSVGGVVVA